MSQFGRLMKAFRVMDGLSTREVARKLGTNKGYVSGIENDKTNPPSPKILQKYWKLFKHHDVGLADLVELAYVTKAPKIIRERLMAAVEPSNPLCKLQVVEVPAKPAEPATIVIRPAGKEAR